MTDSCAELLADKQLTVVFIESDPCRQIRTTKLGRF